MASLAIWVEEPYQSDEIFNPESPLNRDDCLAPFRLLKGYLEKVGGQCHTQDLFRRHGNMPDAVLFLDIPAKPVSEVLGAWATKVKKYVILQESEIIIPRNWDLRLHAQFDVIFTWHDSLIDGKKYFKLNFSQDFPATICKDISKKTKFCTMIAGNKKANHALELYTKRIEAIHWFEENHPDEFDLYGTKWDEYILWGLKIGRRAKNISLLKPFLQPAYPSYKGKIDCKRAILAQYKFAICYENARDIDGYITEKIFDCFFAGCVPIYWGAGNISDHIPDTCFIDKRKFSSYDELYSYLKALSPGEYQGYLASIDRYLKSAESFPFTSNYFVQTIIDCLGY